MFDGPPRPEIDPTERLARLRLARASRIGPITFHEALAHFGSAVAACLDVVVASQADIAREQRAVEAIGGKLLVFGESLYPETLASLPDAPPVMTMIGDGTLLVRPMLAIVGARDASVAGQRFAEHL